MMSSREPITLCDVPYSYLGLINVGFIEHESISFKLPSVPLTDQIYKSSIPYIKISSRCMRNASIMGGNTR